MVGIKKIIQLLGLFIHHLFLFLGLSRHKIVGSYHLKQVVRQGFKNNSFILFLVQNIMVVSETMQVGWEYANVLQFFARQTHVFFKRDGRSL